MRTLVVHTFQHLCPADTVLSTMLASRPCSQHRRWTQNEYPTGTSVLFIKAHDRSRVPLGETKSTNWTWGLCVVFHSFFFFVDERNSKFRALLHAQLNNTRWDTNVLFVVLYDHIFSKQDHSGKIESPIARDLVRVCFCLSWCT